MELFAIDGGLMEFSLICELLASLLHLYIFYYIL